MASKKVTASSKCPFVAATRLQAALPSEVTLTPSSARGPARGVTARQPHSLTQIMGP